MECLLNIRCANVPLIFFFTLNPFSKRVFGDVILLSVVYFWFIMVLISNRVIVIFQSWYILFWNNFWIGHTYWKDNLHNVVCLTDWKRRWVLDSVLACLIPLTYRQYRNAPSLIQRWETSQEKISVSVLLLNLFTIIFC